MIIPKFLPTTTPLTLIKGAQIKTQELNTFFQSVSNDLASLSAVFNDYVIKILSTLPDNFLPGENKLDGTTIYVDSNASLTKDYGAFFSMADNRPFTIYEMFLFMLQIISNLNNGMKEGVVIGSIADPIAINSGDYYNVSWPYTDGIFMPMLFEYNNGTINMASNINVAIVNSQIKIINNNTNTIYLYGIIWHPVLTFGRSAT